MTGLLAIVACDVADTEAPAVSIVFPANSATVNKGDIVIKAVATDNKSVSKVEFSIGGALMGTDNAGASDTFQYTWTDTAAQVVGHSYELVAKAYDAADNSKSSSAITITIAGGGSGTGPTPHGGAIAADETWLASGNPHIITEDVPVNGNATLTIKPGCIIKLDPGTELYAGYGSPGSIVAEGTADSVITFTSNVASPSPGDWKSVSIWDEGMNTASFKYCVFEFGGNNDQGTIYCRNHGVKFSHNVVRKSGTYGIQMQNVGFTAFDSNSVTQCGTYPLSVEAEHIKSIGIGNVFTGNTNDAVYVDNRDVTLTGTWPNPGVPYVFSDGANIGSNSNNPVVTITPGTVLKMFPDKEFYVGYSGSGGLICDGTAGQIVFTSNVPSPSPGDWIALEFYDATIDNQAKLINCKVEYAGSNSDGGNVLFRNCMPTVTGDSIGHSQHYGIWLGGTEHPDSTALETNNVFYDTPDGHIYHQ